jgi:2-C-methyl-D-erythritol 4-phosphate cytidylyltransferase
MNIAVLLAGGTGKRMGGNLPKQFIEVAGRTILEHSIRAFSQHPDIDEIVIVSHADYVELVESIARPYPKVKHVVTGGKERYDSTLSALRLYQQEQTSHPTSDIRVLIHDCVRCLVSQRIISDCIEAMNRYKAVDVAIPCTDTICEVNAEGHIVRIPPRASLRNVQTPQAFHLDTIAEAYRIGLQDPAFVTTDDCGVVHHYLPEVDIYVVEGESTNIKITYPADLVLAEKILKDKK